jgi:glycosyltransferase involved in cell wall biosynthesis
MKIPVRNSQPSADAGRGENTRGQQTSARAEAAPGASPRVSVVIPLFNSQRYVGQAIESVLGQTCPPSQLIVVDDGSTDNSRSIVQRYLPRVEYVWQPNSGVGAARNRGVSLCRGELLAFLDDDDRWLPNKLAQQLRALAEDPTRDMVSGLVRQFVSPDIEAAAAKRVRVPPEAMPAVLPGAMLIRKEAFLRVGFFREDCRLGETVDWWCRAIESGVKGFTIAEVVLERRVHDENAGIMYRDARTDYARILKAALDRRRAGAPR